MRHDEIGFWNRAELGGFVTRAGFRTLEGGTPLVDRGPSWLPYYLRLIPAGQPLRWPDWAVPPVQPTVLDVPTIVWAWERETPDTPVPRRLANRFQGAFDAFVKLGDAHPVRVPALVLRFVKRYGPLGLCRHRLPATHADACSSELVVGLCADHGLVSTHSDECHAKSPVIGGLGWETVAEWRSYVYWMRHMITLAHVLRAESPVALVRWQKLLEGRPGHGSPAARDYADTAHQRWHLMHMVNEWLEMSGVRPAFVWDAAAVNPQVRLGGGETVFAVLAVELAFTIARGSQRGLLDSCTACGKPIVRAKRTREGYRAFCDQLECKREQARLAKRDQRAGQVRWRRKVAS